MATPFSLPTRTLALWRTKEIQSFYYKVIIKSRFMQAINELINNIVLLFVDEAQQGPKKLKLGSSDDIDVLMYTTIVDKVLNVVDSSIKTDIFEPDLTILPNSFFRFH